MIDSVFFIMHRSYNGMHAGGGAGPWGAAETTGSSARGAAEGSGQEQGRPAEPPALRGSGPQAWTLQEGPCPVLTTLNVSL